MQRSVRKSDHFVPPESQHRSIPWGDSAERYDVTVKLNFLTALNFQMCHSYCMDLWVTARNVFCEITVWQKWWNAFWAVLMDCIGKKGEATVTLTIGVWVHLWICLIMPHKMFTMFGFFISFSLQQLHLLYIIWQMYFFQLISPLVLFHFVKWQKKMNILKIR